MHIMHYHELTHLKPEPDMSSSIIVHTVIFIYINFIFAHLKFKSNQGKFKTFMAFTSPTTYI